MNAQATGTVERVVDGDTLVAIVDGKRRRVRVLGIDSPESVKPGAADQPCGQEASARATAWVRKHRVVRLAPDDAAPDADRYGRLLRWVRPTDGTPELSAVQVNAGLARVNSYGQDLQGLDDLQAAQTRAKLARRGFWGNGCTG